MIDNERFFKPPAEAGYMLADQMRKAEIAMMKVGIRALQLGAFVSKPIFEGARYDYIIERDGKLYRAQVKYADGKPGHTTGVVYVPKIDKVCWFETGVFCGKQGLYIRIAPTKSGRVKGCLAADDYLW